MDEGKISALDAFLQKAENCLMVSILFFHDDARTERHDIAYFDPKSQETCLIDCPFCPLAEKMRKNPPAFLSLWENSCKDIHRTFNNNTEALRLSTCFYIIIATGIAFLSVFDEAELDENLINYFDELSKKYELPDMVQDKILILLREFQQFQQNEKRNNLFAAIEKFLKEGH